MLWPRRPSLRTLTGRRQILAAQLQARQAWRTALIVLVSVLAGLAAAWFARFCDLAMETHAGIYAARPEFALLLLPMGFAAAVWITRRFAPEAAGSGIPQVIAAAEHRWRGRWGGQRVTLRTALWKVVLSGWMLLCGASIGREGPTVQVAAGITRTLTRGLRGGPGRRAMIIAGGAAGVAAAFNTPIAGVVFAFEELGRSFERRTHTTIILVVVVAGFTAYALQGDYAYFGTLSRDSDLRAAWLAAPVLGVAGGLAGGCFSRLLAWVIGPRENGLARWRRGRPILFAFLCGVVAAVAAVVSGGVTFGAGYEEARALLHGDAGGGANLATWKFVASLAAAVSGAPGGIFAPSLAIGAGMGSAFSETFLAFAGREAVVLGMAGYLSGVVQAPLTSAVILMEMTRDPGLVAPLMLTSLLARWVSGLIMPTPIYHLLAEVWRLTPESPVTPRAK